MKIIPISMCGLLLLSTPCFSADVLTYGSSRPAVLTSVSRSVEASECKVDLNEEQARKSPAVNGSQPFFDEGKINKLLDKKATLLIAEIPKLLDILNTIMDELRVRILATKVHDCERATELATIGSYGFSLHKSASIILQNVMPFKTSKEGRVVLNASLAITGSGTLKTRIDEFMSILGRSEDTRDIGCDMLRETNEKIKSVTNDIDFVF